MPSAATGSPRNAAHTSRGRVPTEGAPVGGEGGLGQHRHPARPGHVQRHPGRLHQLVQVAEGLQHQQVDAGVDQGAAPGPAARASRSAADTRRRCCTVTAGPTDPATSTAPPGGRRGLPGHPHPGRVDLLPCGRPARAAPAAAGRRRRCWSAPAPPRRPGSCRGCGAPAPGRTGSARAAPGPAGSRRRAARCPSRRPRRAPRWPAAPVSRVRRSPRPCHHVPSTSTISQATWASSRSW